MRPRPRPGEEPHQDRQDRAGRLDTSRHGWKSQCPAGPFSCLLQPNCKWSPSPGGEQEAECVKVRAGGTIGTSKPESTERGHITPEEALTIRGLELG